MGRSMDYKETIEQLGRDDVTATFGIVAGHENYETLQRKPESIYYGVAYGTDEDGTVLTQYRIPLLTFAFNKYDGTLPPWRNVMEIVLASEDSDGVTEAAFIDPTYRGTHVTGDLKTVEVSAEGPSEHEGNLPIIDGEMPQ